LENILVGLIVLLAAGYLVRRYYLKLKAHTDQEGCGGGDCCTAATCNGCDVADSCSSADRPT
jgi:hypothetical protein